MNKLSFYWLASLLFLFMPIHADDFVTIHVQNPGTLVLSQEALFAKKLRVTGKIDARDFKTLKTVTMYRTEVLDLTQANIYAYKGSDGCYAPKTSDWIVTGKEYYHEYPANTFPIHAFSEILDNSISKYREGSFSLKHLILPVTLQGFEDEAIYKTNTLSKLEVSKKSEFLKCEDQVIYTYDGKKLLLAAPVRTQGIELPSSVEVIDKNAFADMKFEFLSFHSATPPQIQKTNFQVAYIKVPDSHLYDDLLPTVDHIKDITPIVLTELKEGTLQEIMQSKGYYKKDIHDLQIQGSMNASDMQYIYSLPSLYYLNLSEASINQNKVSLGNSKLCKIKLPQGAYALNISSDNYLSGNLEIPEGVYSFEGKKLRFDSVSFPATLQYLQEYALGSSLIKSADLSKCTSLISLNAFSSCYFLEDVKLPPHLKKLEGLTNSPIREITFPNTLEELNTGYNWNVRELIFPPSLKKIKGFTELVGLEHVDFSACTNLEEFDAFSCCPKLETVDLSMCPVLKLSGLNGEYLSGGVVVSGKTHYPAPVSSGLKNIKMPYTVQEVNAFHYCDSLYTLSMEECYQLEKIEGIHYCDILQKVTLPPSLQQINAFNECDSLRTLVLSSQTPPEFIGNPEDTTIQHVVLFVPDGHIFHYTDDTFWSRSIERKEGGFSVHLTCDKGLNLPLKGSGLYTAGTNATFTAPEKLYQNPILSSYFKGWYDLINDQLITETQFTINQHLKLKAFYEEGEADLQQADIFCEIEVEQETGIRLQIATENYEGAEYYQSGTNQPEHIADNVSKTIYLNPGKNQIGLIGNINSWTLDNLNPKESEITIKHWKVVNPDLIKQITLQNVNFPIWDFSEFQNLETLNCTKVGWDTLDVSKNEHLNYLCCQENNLRFLNLKNNTQLDILNCTHNKLEKLILPDHDLSTIYIYNNSFAFSSVTPSMYQTLLNSYTPPIDLPFNIPERYWIEDHLLDLTSEQFDAAESTPTKIEIQSYGEYEADEEEPYIYRFPDKIGFYIIVLTNPSMPELSFQAEKQYTTTSIHPSLNSEPKIHIYDKTVNISLKDPNTQVEIFTTDGRQISGEKTDTCEYSFHVPTSGIYLLRLTHCQGDFITIKFLVP